jgi:aminoacyl-tRNA hydrolase
LQARQVADIVVFVGSWASSVLKADRSRGEHALRAFGRVRDAAEYINSITRAGDLVLLKGTNKQDHLLRIILARTGDVACWRDDCRRNCFCDECPDRNTPSGPPRSVDSAPAVGASPPLPLSGQRPIEPDEFVIVGLGNPESRYAGTPHNIGYEVVDRLATSLGLTWSTFLDAWIARGSFNGRCLCLVKMRMPMNMVGLGLKRLSNGISFQPEQCVLVHDDLDLPLGTVRARLSGGAGGHRGVVSVLEAFQTDAFRRVKLGVGRPDAKLNRTEYVLSPLTPAARTVIDQAVHTAEARILEMATEPTRGRQGDPAPLSG